ncbi:DUF6783 domain-containing protein [uncultured Robinsoniella sp.]
MLPDSCTFQCILHSIVKWGVQLAGINYQTRSYQYMKINMQI